MRIMGFVFIALTTLFSCKTYKFSKSDLEWQPYRQGDVLIFESSRKEIDTIKIESIKIYTNPDDPLAVFSKKTQSLFVEGLRSHAPKKDIMGNIYHSSHCNILKIGASKETAYMYFELELGSDKMRYPTTVVSVDELENLSVKNEEIEIKAKENYDNMKEYPFDLRYIYWSKNLGYLKLEFRDNYSWKLKSFLRDGKELL